MDVILRVAQLYSEFDRTNFLPIEPCYPVAMTYVLYTLVENPEPKLLHVLLFITIQTLNDLAPVTFDEYHKVMGVRITCEELTDVYQRLGYYVPCARTAAYEQALPLVQQVMFHSLSDSDAFEDAHSTNSG